VELTADSNSHAERLRVRRWALAWVSAGLCVVLLVWLVGNGAASRNPPVLRVALPPDMAPERATARYGGLIAYLSERVGVPVRIEMAHSYQDLIDEFAAGRVDMARFGGASYVIAHERAGAVPLVTREVDSRFTTLFVARSGGEVRTLSEFAAHVMAFGDPLSTSGHLMPRHHLRQLGIDPEQYFTHILFTGAHDATAFAVLSGKADLGAVNGVVLNQMLRDGSLPPGAIQVVWESPPYPNYVWAVSPRLRTDLADRLRDAFLALSMEQPEQAAVLEAAGTSTYLPAVGIELDSIRQAVMEQGLL